MDPYLRPLYDGLFDMLGAETYERLVEKQIIEVAPLAYMRGRTLDDSFIILDEAQNTTPEQMKMFLTRMGVPISNRLGVIRGWDSNWFGGKNFGKNSTIMTIAAITRIIPAAPA